MCFLVSTARSDSGECVRVGAPFSLSRSKLVFQRQPPDYIERESAKLESCPQRRSPALRLMHTDILVAWREIDRSSHQRRVYFAALRIMAKRIA
jgi:hypothetical protein